MTHRVYMNADNMFLGMAKYLIDGMEADEQIYGEKQMLGVNIVVTCVTAVEAFSNKVFITKVHLKHYDDLKLLSKIDTIHDLNYSTVNWGDNPYQTFKQLVSIRNWLIHFKSPHIGLMGADNSWIKDPIQGNKHPKIDPFTVLSKQNCVEYYNNCRAVILDLGKIANLPYYMYNFAETEKYDYFHIG